MKNRSAILAVTSLIFLAPQTVFIPSVQASTTESVWPDEEVMWDKYGKVNDASLREYYVGYSDAGFEKQRAALKFDLSNATAPIQKAVLRIHIVTVEDLNGSDSVLPGVALIGSADDDWSDNTDNAPAQEREIAGRTTAVSGTVEHPWREFDVTQFVKDQMGSGGNKLATFVLVGEEGTPGVQFAYANHTYGTSTLRPHLELTFGAAGAKPPVVTDATIDEDNHNANGLVISPHAEDTETPVTHFKITDIVGGRLYWNNGTTQINNGDFITAVEASKGLKYFPNTDANESAGDDFSFQVRAAQDGSGAGLSDPTEAVITVSEVNDKPVPNDDSLSSIGENSGDNSIPFADLLGNDSKGAVNESGQTLEIASVSADPSVGTVSISGTNVIFTPAQDYADPASFTYKVRDNGTTNGNPDPQTSDDEATVTFNIDPKANKPTVTDADTAEDTTTTSGLVITADNSGGVTTNYYKITGITGGTLFKNDGTTLIANDSFITAAEGLAGLKFKPNANTHDTTGFGFLVQASPVNTGSRLSGTVAATVRVSEVNDQPVAANDTWTDVNEDAAPLRIPFSHLLDNDNAGPNESGQQLTITPTGTPTGGTVTVDGDALVFTPTPNFNGAASFKYQVTDNGTTNGTADPKTAEATLNVTILSVADTPTVTDATTNEDQQNGDGLVISRSTLDGMDVQYLKFTDIQGGTLYRNDGTTPIANNSFIPMSEGASGLKFTPALNANSQALDTFSFKVQAALDTSGTGLSGSATATITVNAVNDAPVAENDGLGAIGENSGDRMISFAELIGNDSRGATNESGQTLTITAVERIDGGDVRINDSGTHVIFTPEANFRGLASFRYTVEDEGGLTSQALVTFTIDARTDRPSVTDAETPEDTMSASGLVLTPTSAGGATTTHFKISGITGGKLYQSNGTTEILDGAIITVSEGGAGLKFKPSEHAHGNTGFGFQVQAAADANGGLLSDAAEATIIVTEVNDTPVAQDDTLAQVAKGTEQVNITYAQLTANDEAGPHDEQQWQSFTITDVTPVTGGTVELANGRIEFKPTANFMGLAKFTYTVSDNGRTNGTDDPETDTAEVSFYVLDEDQPMIMLHGEQTLYLLKGQAYQEPGYAADDEVDGDLTNAVTTDGSVNSNALGTYVLRYNVADSSGNDAPEVTRTVHVVSNELTDLTVDATGLTPAFDPGEDTYTLKVPSNQKTVTITADTEDPTATVTINGQVADLNGQKKVDLQVGKNDITIVVTARGGASKTYNLEVTRQSNPITPLPGNGNGNGNPKTRPAKVVTQGNGNEKVVQVDITRTQGAGGKVIDSVALQGNKTDEVVAQAFVDGAKLARIVIDDIPGEPADEVTVNVTRDSLAKMKNASLGLAIEAGGARITLSSETLSLLSTNGKDLYFRVVPIRQAAEQQQVEDRVLDAEELQQYAHGRNVRAEGQPFTIETNYTDQDTKVMFPLTGIDIPTDSAERRAFLNGLAVFVEHTDGEKEVEAGELVYDKAGNPIGIEIDIQKFSTFTIISTDQDFKTYLRYISGYPDGTFHPTNDVTRAEMAAMIARQMELNEVAANGYTDLAATHWASKAVLQLTAAGILTGDVNGSFRPGHALTRAEIAIIAAKLKGLQLTKGQAPTFKDAQGSWASSAIAAVQQAGLMIGFEDGTFRPNETLTREEAVTVLNRLFERPLLQEQGTSWPDVSTGGWASAAIESASHDLRVYKDGHIEKIEEE